MEQIEKAIELFKGKIYQRPPLKSRVKRSIRIRTIREIEILDYQDKYLLMRVSCDPGTYMRKLAHDIGLILGVGSHMRELRRTRTGPFKEDETLIRFQDLSEAVYLWRMQGDERLLARIILPVEVSTVHLPKIVVLDTAVDAIAHGASLASPGIAMLTRNIEAGKRVAIYTLKGELVAIGTSLMNSDEIIKINKGIVVRVDRVLMPPGVYPKAWKTGGG